MSWQEYVDDHLVKTGHVDKGAIFSIKGDSQWAATPGFVVSSTELKDIISGLDGQIAKLYADGFKIQGKKYKVIIAEGRSLYGREIREGVVIVKTTQAILIAHYGDGMIAGNAAQTVEHLADYLIGLGY